MDGKWTVKTQWQEDKKELKIGTVSMVFKYDDGKTPDFNFSKTGEFGAIKDMGSLAAVKEAIALGSDMVAIEHTEYNLDELAAYKAAPQTTAPPSKLKNILPVSEGLLGFDNDVLEALKQKAEAARAFYEQSIIDEAELSDFMNGGNAPVGVKISTEARVLKKVGA